MSQQKNLVLIPKIFYSEENQAPFKKCMSCKSNLLEEGTEYVIEKAIKQYEDYSATDTILETLADEEKIEEHVGDWANPVVGSIFLLAKYRKDLLNRNRNRNCSWRIYCW